MERPTLAWIPPAGGVVSSLPGRARNSSQGGRGRTSLTRSSPTTSLLDGMTSRSDAIPGSARGAKESRDEAQHVESAIGPGSEAFGAAVGGNGEGASGVYTVEIRLSKCAKEIAKPAVNRNGQAEIGAGAVIMEGSGAAVGAITAEPGLVPSPPRTQSLIVDARRTVETAWSQGKAMPTTVAGSEKHFVTPVAGAGAGAGAGGELADETSTSGLIPVPGNSSTVSSGPMAPDSSKATIMGANTAEELSSRPGCGAGAEEVSVSRAQSSDFAGPVALSAVEGDNSSSGCVGTRAEVEAEADGASPPGAATGQLTVGRVGRLLGRGRSLAQPCPECDKASIGLTAVCAVCDKVFHANCVGFSASHRDFPPPRWRCPWCPGGSIGVHLKAALRTPAPQGVPSIGGTLPWCIICEGDLGRGRNRSQGGRPMRQGIGQCATCFWGVHLDCMVDAPDPSVSGGVGVGEGKVNTPALSARNPDKSWHCNLCRRHKEELVLGVSSVGLEDGEEGAAVAGCIVGAAGHGMGVKEQGSKEVVRGENKLGGGVGLTRG
ncbi:unnamed protein product, partial [Discosporangium mesarthrocarpum]